MDVSEGLKNDDVPPLDDEEASRGTYVPAKLRAIATQLLMDEDLEGCLDRLRAMYPNLSSRRSALCKLKAAVVESNRRHPLYATHMQAWEARVKERVREQEASAESLKRMQECYSFQSCSLKRQLHIQRKIQLGQGDGLFSHPDDLAFVARAKLAPDFVFAIRLGADEAREVQEQQETKAKHLSNSVVRIDDGDAIVIWARKVLKDPKAKVLPLAVAVAIATGRRMIEIFQKGQFAEEGQKYALRFTGQAKAGLQEIVGITRDQPLEYSIPVLASAGNIVRAVAKIRGLSQSLTVEPKTITSRWCRKLNEFVKQHVHEELGFHDLRTLYALITYESFKPHTYSINGWICKTLGHTGISMSVAYTRMQVYGINKIRRHNREAAEDYAA
jgi:hypothetical protein